MGKQAEGICISFKVCQVFPLRRGQLFSVGLFFFQCHALSFRKEGGDGAFAGVAEGWISQIMGEAGGGNDRADFRQVGALQVGTALKDGFGYIIAQRTAHTGYLQTMCQPVVDKYASGQGEHLRFVLQSPERGGEDKAVVIPLKFGTVLVSFFVKFFQAESLGRYEGIPVHDDNYINW